MRYQAVCYGFDPTTMECEMTEATRSNKQDFYMMVDINRLLILTTPFHNTRLSH